MIYVLVLVAQITGTITTRGNIAAFTTETRCESRKQKLIERNPQIFEGQNWKKLVCEPLEKD